MNEEDFAASAIAVIEGRKLQSVFSCNSMPLHVSP